MKKNSFLAFLFSLVLMIGIGVINCSGVFAATVGDQLLEAEDGWKRYDDTYEAIEYGENVAEVTQEGDYKETLHGVQKTKLGEVARFSFTGDKLRLIGLKSSNYSKKIKIEIDGETDYFDSNLNSTQINDQFQTVIYSRDDLAYTKHNVIITHISFIENPCTYDFRIDAIDIDADGELLPYSKDKKILNIEPEKEKINLNDNVTANVTIDNITEIAAEDMIIKYDSEKLKFLGAEAVEGIKVVKDDESEGQLRVILASQGKDNIANAKKVLLKLNFQGIAVGDALVDITKGKISDGIEMERDLLDEECGQATITIEDFKDPSKDGEFTLLDLAIDGRYYGLNPVDYPQYKTDIVENGAIDDDDLLQIGQYMMENPNYNF